jgi:RNA polymerase sigma-70 factor, ECF subfamily
MECPRLAGRTGDGEVRVNRWSEKLLVRRILAGDYEAYQQLIQLHHQAIYRLLVHLCRDTHLAEDLTQETFAAAWAGIGAFGGSASLATWLHRIAYRKFVDTHRRKQPVAAIEPDQIAERAHSDAPDPLDEVLASEQSRRLYQALARLEPAERDVVVLHYLQALSYREMAEVLDEPSGTIKWRTSRALTKLKTLLEGRLEDETGPNTTRQAAEPRIA